MWTWQVAAAVCGLAGGILASLTGSLMLAAAWLTGHQDSGLSLYGIGNVLLLSMIPLLMLGAHFLDLSEQHENRGQRASPDGACGGANRYGQTQSRFAGVAALLLFLCEFSTPTQAQQTIFNVPSTDVLDKGKVYGELDASLKPNNSETVNRFSSFVPRVVVGTGGRVEIGLNVNGNIQPGADTTTLVPAIKWKPYQGKDNGISIVVGDHLFIPARNRAYMAGTYVYAEISKTFKSGTRLTAGGYDFTRHVVAAGNRAGGQFGFEQPVNKKVTFAADYFTGKHAAGYFTPGFIFKFSPKVTGYAGYSIGNQNPSRGNNFFLLEVGYNFN
jgi:hypothetical protein